MKNSLQSIARRAWMLFLLIVPVVMCNAQSRTITSAGTWSNTAIWSGGNIADVVGETTSINNNSGTVTVGANYTVGSVAMNNGNTLTINSGRTLNIGNSTTSEDLTSGNSATINVTGTLIIWGDLVVGNTLDLNVAAGGVLIIKGNVSLNNGGDLAINGNVQIDGNFNGGNDTDFIVNGTVTVGGNLSVGNNSDPSGSGTVTVGGTCSDGSSAFCGVGPLPIKLLSFESAMINNGIELKWVTAMERDFDYFLLERANSDLDFVTLGKLQSHGGLDITAHYSFVDDIPYHGKNYYRLKSVDIDGTFVYSNVIVGEWLKPAGRISIYPNPVIDRTFNINLSDDIIRPRRLELYELRGSLVFQTDISAAGKTIEVPEKLRSGVYMVKVRSDEGIDVLRIVVP